jgi:NAD(P)-dependent dehydrogenase (short-subunit alcohol dehydrogenase family)
MHSNQTHNDSMTGKRVIITGPTSGIGKETAAQLAALGAEVILGCRDVAAGERTKDEIARRTGAQNCVVMPVDTSSRESIHAFARQCRERYPRVDVLINNAGLYRSRRQVSVDGVELTFATNVLGYYVLTRGLLDLLKASAPARIVNVASSFVTDIDLTDLQFERRSYDGQKAYMQSKACDRMLTWAFAQRLEGSGVTANALAPGLVPSTGLYRDTSRGVRLMMRLIGGFRPRNAAQAADTAVWLAGSPEVEGISGCFFEERREMACKFRDVQAGDRLWAICEELSGAV